MPSDPRAQSGFTLLEVLAAVAILGIWYVILSTVAIQGLRAQGESQRRLEASFIADEVIAELEAGFSAGKAPEQGLNEYERDDYDVRIETSSYALEIPELEVDSSASRSTLDLELPSLPVVDLLAGDTATKAAPLRAIHVEILWFEGFEERRVVRDTFGFDRESVQDELAELEEALGGTPGGAGTPGTEEAEDGSSGGPSSDQTESDLLELGESLRRGAEQ